jgi:hypothetical protein
MESFSYVALSPPAAQIQSYHGCIFFDEGFLVYGDEMVQLRP